jgi:hypothetical protein
LWCPQSLWTQAIKRTLFFLCRPSTANIAIQVLLEEVRCAMQSSPHVVPSCTRFARYLYAKYLCVQLLQAVAGARSTGERT